MAESKFVLIQHRSFDSLSCPRWFRQKSAEWSKFQDSHISI